VNVPGGDGGRRVSEHVGLDAIPPTVADLLDVESPPEWRGESLEPAVSGGESPDQEPVVSVTVRGEEVTEQPIPRSLSDGDLLVSVRDAEWTYIENADTAETELYHRPSDPTQQEDLSADRTVRRGARGRRAVRADRRGPRRRTSRQTDGRGAADDDGEDEEVDEHLEARLEALGYR